MTDPWVIAPPGQSDDDVTPDLLARVSRLHDPVTTGYDRL